MKVSWSYRKRPCNVCLSGGGVQELFGNVGRVKTARCHYDARGKNLGTAEVEFVRAEDAVAAKREYDGVVLDGVLF